MATGYTRTGAVMEAIRARVASHVLAPGDRLPSIRRLAAGMAVSPSTVVEAYDRLVAEGAIRSRPGSGFYVAGGRPRSCWPAPARGRTGRSTRSGCPARRSTPARRA